MVYEVEADGFLRKMVRSLVGGLIAAGRGIVTVEDLRRGPRARDRGALAGPGPGPRASPSCASTTLPAKNPARSHPPRCTARRAGANIGASSSVRQAPCHCRIFWTSSPRIRRSSRSCASIDFARLPRHVAIIMDGNGRWAQLRHKPRVEGHRAGIASVRDVVETSARLGLQVLTLYAFSVENWKRPRERGERPS